MSAVRVRASACRIKRTHRARWKPSSGQLIHMNGRVYDYALGRFLSVDPFIQFPLNSQSLNPYSYVLNNPLSGTDPTGYCSVSKPGSQICDFKAEKAEKESSGSTSGGTPSTGSGSGSGQGKSGNGATGQGTGEAQRSQTPSNYDTRKFQMNGETSSNGTKPSGEVCPVMNPAACNRSEEGDKKWRSQAVEQDRTASAEILATPQQEAAALSTRDDFFDSKGTPQDKEHFEYMMPDLSIRRGCPVCSTPYTTVELGPIGFVDSGTVHNHPPGPGGEFPGPVDANRLQQGPVFYWTPSIALRVIEMRKTNAGDLSATVRTIKSVSGRMDRAVEQWNTKMSEKTMLHLEDRAR